MPKLTWIGKEAVEKHHQDVPTHLLEPVAELSCGDSDSGNLIVQGDNLIALKALLPRYAGKVKCIYIDPPYNTGNEGWAYNDNVNSPEIKKWLGKVVGAEAEDLSRHDKWLCMMYPRLVLLKQFLREDGVIFVSIDDNEQAYLKLLMDEIFGSVNFIACFMWKRKKEISNDSKNVSLQGEYIISYSKSTNALFNLSSLSDEYIEKSYNEPTSDFPLGKWRPVPITVSKGLSGGGYEYEIKTPTGKIHNRLWAYPEKSFQNLLKDKKIYFGKLGDAVPQRVIYAHESNGQPTTNYWDNVATNKEGKKELLSLFSDNYFSTPKPTRLIERVLQLSTDKDSIVLDSFAGSGTTAHAVLKLNQQDCGNRKFVLVEMDEVIAESVTAERNKRVIEGYENAKGESVAGLGDGFQFCRLSDEPLFAADGEVRADVTFAQLASYVWFNETKMGYEGKGDSPLLGVFEGRAIYLLYNGILKDIKPEGGNILTKAVFNSLPPFEGQKVIYAAAYQGGVNWIKKEQIIFKQTPYALETKI